MDTSECSNGPGFTCPRDLQLLSIFQGGRGPTILLGCPWFTFFQSLLTQVEMNKRTNSFAIVQVISAVPFMFVVSCPLLGSTLGKVGPSPVPDIRLAHFQHNVHPPFIWAWFQLSPLPVPFACIRPFIQPITTTKTNTQQKWSIQRYVVHPLKSEHDYDDPCD